MGVLSTCPACNRSVSSAATACPGCGHPINVQRPSPARPEPVDKDDRAFAEREAAARLLYVEREARAADARSGERGRPIWKATLAVGMIFLAAALFVFKLPGLANLLMGGNDPDGTFLFGFCFVVAAALFLASTAVWFRGPR